MKRLTYLVIILLLCGPVISQAGSIEKFMRKQARQEGVKLIRVPGLVKYFVSSHIEDEFSKKLVKQFRGVRVLTCETSDGCEADYSAMASGAREVLIDDDYVSMLEVIEDNETVMIYAKRHKRKKYIKRIVVVVKENDEFTIVRIKGKFKLGDLNMDKLMDIKNGI